MGIRESKAKLSNKVRVMPAKYAEAMSAFFGVDVSGSIPVASYKAKIGPGMPDKWEKNLKSAFGL